MKDSINRVGDKESPFILGKIGEGYNETQFKDRNQKVKKQINRKLRDIRDDLNLSQPLTLGSARDCYANTLDRNDTNIKKISQMLGHSNVVVTEHYLSGLNPDETFGINDPIL